MKTPISLREAATALHLCCSFLSHALAQTTYDYVVVGGGVSGLVVANRLTEDSEVTVLVIERGDFDNKPEAIVPWYANLMDTSVMINPVSAPNPGLNNATWNVAVGAVVGGGSIVGGMAYFRASEADYDAWEELGNPGWGWDGLLPYFIKSNSFTPPNPDVVAEWNITWDPVLYGTNSPLKTTIPNFIYPDVATLWDAWRHEPVPQPQDINSGVGPGAYWAAQTIDASDATRATARKAYYDPVFLSRPNLHIMTGQTATEILFNGLNATGVKIVSVADNSVQNVYASKEVILAAGAIQTPQLLMVSGIGPTFVLQAAGITVKKDLAGVGNNFQDHATTIMQFDLPGASFPNPTTIFTNVTYNATVWEEYLDDKTGPIAAGSSNAVALLSLSQMTSAASSIIAELTGQLTPLAYLPDAYATYPSLLAGYLAQRAILARNLATNAAAVGSFPFPGSGLAPAPLLKPLSRGTITLNPAAPLSGLPLVQYNTFQNPVDASLVLAIVRRLRAFWANPYLAPLGPPTEISPGTQYQTDEEILGALKAGVLWPSLAHASGSCAMMPESLGGCVAPDLKVYGVEGLSIVDASVVPLIPGAPMMSTAYAVAEKAADLIKARA